MPETTRSHVEHKYDAFFSDDETYANTLIKNGIEGATVSVPEVSVGDQLISADCLERILHRDPHFKALIEQQAVRYRDTNNLELLRSIRGDSEAIFAIQSFFSQSVKDKQSLMPERVADNSEKNIKRPNYKGYEKRFNLTSQEYVSILATSMVIGSFNFDYSRSSPIVINPRGNVLMGQHRAAALIALGLSFDDDWVKDNFNIEYADR
jgi:hypothetical protein